MFLVVYLSLRADGIDTVKIVHVLDRACVSLHLLTFGWLRVLLLDV